MRNIFKRGDIETDVAKTGDNYHATLTVRGELVMAVFQPPINSEAGMDLQAGIQVYDASGNVKVDRSKVVKGGEPYILFKEDNAAGLKLVNTLPLAKENLTDAIKQYPDVKINIDKLTESNAYSVQNNSRVVFGSSAIQISNKTVSIIRSPKIDSHKKETIEMLLKFLVKSLMDEQLKYRSNIMLLDMIDNTLKVVAHYNMDGDPDRNFKIGSNAGGAGKALERDNIEIVDLRTHPHAYYNIDSTKVWKNMLSLFSIPIHDTEQNIIGILNIDTDKNTDETKFYDPPFQSYMGMATDIFGRLLTTSENDE